MKTQIDLIVTSNSPGEMAGWLKPLLEKLDPKFRVIVVVTPCQFSSGREIEYARSLPGIFSVIIPEEYRRWIFHNIAPAGINFNKQGLILFLGGDPLHTQLLSKKLKYPAVDYLDKPRFRKFFACHFIASEKVMQQGKKKGVAKEKMVLVGDLMADLEITKESRKELAKRFNLESHLPVVNIMPGSKPSNIHFTTPIFLRAAEVLLQRQRNVQFILSLSPFISEGMLENSLKRSKDNEWLFKRGLGTTGIIKTENNAKYILTDNGLKARIISPEDFIPGLAVSDLTFTLPNTACAQAAALGIPSVVILPLFRPEEFQFEGLLGILGNLPGLGKYVKWVALMVLDRYVRLLSIPNIKAGRKIIPEVRGNVKAEMVAKEAAQLLADRIVREKMGADIKRVMGGTGAAEKISRGLDELIK